MALSAHPITILILYPILDAANKFPFHTHQKHTSTSQEPPRITNVPRVNKPKLLQPPHARDGHPITRPLHDDGQRRLCALPPPHGLCLRTAPEVNPRRSTNGI